MSEQAKHTPGPWSYWHDECASCEREGKKEFVIDGPPGAEHGQFSHEPDARLIAAAPDLLEAAKAAFYQIVGFQVAHEVQSNGWQWDDSSPRHVSVTADLIRAAIAKALGQDGSAS